MSDSNDIRRMEGHKPVPTGFLVFFFALIAWGFWYGFRYTPEISGWSSYKELAARQAIPSPGGGGAPAAAGKNPYAAVPSAAGEGEKIYEKECAGCHGDDMKNPSGGPDLRAPLAFGADEGALFESVMKGRPGGMPGFASSLGTDRTWKVVTYVLHERGGK